MNTELNILTKVVSILYDMYIVNEGYIMMIECRLRVLMAEKNINIVELSEKIKVNRNTISSLYNGKSRTYNDDILNKLCDFFECTVGDILVYKPGAKAA